MRHTWGREELFTGFSFGGANVRDHWEELGVGWEDNIKIDFTEVGIDGANLIRLDQNRIQRWAFVRTLMNHRVP
jgi:hypothetical protein